MVIGLTVNGVRSGILQGLLREDGAERRRKVAGHQEVTEMHASLPPRSAALSPNLPALRLQHFG